MTSDNTNMHHPIILSTWSFGQRANNAAWPTLEKGGSSLDAVELACRDAEADLNNHTVGIGGFPDRSGRVSLDASIMLAPAKAGSVCYLRDYPHPISVARKVMEKSPHVLLAGDGAGEFARLHGFESADLLTEEAAHAWENWRKEQGRKPVVKRNVEELGLSGIDVEGSHDTIGVIALDSHGDLAGGCTTSGLAFKIPGRVGDSPIIGHGLYVEPKVGAAVCTGHGELVMGVCGSFLAIETLRRGGKPEDAAFEVIQRIQSTHELHGEDQVGVIVLGATGNWGAASIRAGFRVAVRSQTYDAMLDPHRILLG
jgi:isoaspartyl peptidase/L-asparaginase-like protein (Ntn-hydrolase superfamily)